MKVNQFLPTFLKKSCNPKDYAKSLAYFIDRKTALSREFREIIFGIYRSGGLYQTNGEIDENVFPRDYWSMPVLITPMRINGVSSDTGYDQMYVTGLELAQSVNGVLNNEDMDNHELLFSKADYQATLRELLEACNEDYAKFKSGLIDQITLRLPYPFFIEGERYDQEILITADQDLDVVLERDPNSFPVVEFSIIETLSSLSQVVNINIANTIILNMLGTAESLTMSDLTAGLSSKLGEAVNDTIEQIQDTVAIATDESFEIPDRIKFVVDKIAEEVDEMEQEEEILTYDDNDFKSTFMSSNFTGTSASAMWSAGGCGAAVKKAAMIVGKVIKAAATIVFKAIKAVAGLLTRLWKKYVEPAYISKDFVKAEGTTDETYCDVPLYQYGGIDNGEEFDPLLLGALVKNALSDQKIVRAKLNTNVKPYVIPGVGQKPLLSMEDSESFEHVIEVGETNLDYNKSITIIRNDRFYDGTIIDRAPSNATFNGKYALRILTDDGMVRTETGLSATKIDAENIRYAATGMKVGSWISNNATVYGQESIYFSVINEGSDCVITINPTRTNATGPDTSSNLAKCVVSNTTFKSASYLVSTSKITYLSVALHTTSDNQKVYRMTTNGAVTGKMNVITINLNNGLTLKLSCSFATTGRFNVSCTATAPSPVQANVSRTLSSDTAGFYYSVDASYEYCAVRDIIIPREVYYQSTSVTEVKCLNEQTLKLNVNTTGDVMINDVQSVVGANEIPYASRFWSIVLTSRHRCSSNGYCITYGRVSESNGVTWGEIERSDISRYSDGSIETQWITPTECEWRSVPLTALSDQVINDLMKDVGNPIDKGCAAVSRYKFGCIQVIQGSDEQLRMTVYASPIKAESWIRRDNGDTKIGPSGNNNGRYRLTITENGTMHVSSISADDVPNILLGFVDEMSDVPSSYDGEEGDLTAYQDMYAAYQVMDFYMWCLTHLDSDVNSYFDVDGCKIFANKPYITSGEVNNSQLVNLLYYDTINEDNASVLLYSYLYQLLSNKSSYMKVHQLMFGDYPTFFPYLVGDRLNRPKWHISTDEDIQNYVDKVCTAVMVAVMVIAAVIIVGVVAWKIKRALKAKITANNQREFDDFARGHELSNESGKVDNEISEITKVLGGEKELTDEEHQNLLDRLDSLKQRKSELKELITDNNKLSAAHNRSARRWSWFASKLGVSTTLTEKVKGGDTDYDIGNSYELDDSRLLDSMGTVQANIVASVKQSAEEQSVLQEQTQSVVGQASDAITAVAGLITNLKMPSAQPIEITWNR